MLKPKKMHKFQIHQFFQQHSLPDWKPFTGCLSKEFNVFCPVPQQPNTHFPHLTLSSVTSAPLVYGGIKAFEDI